MMPIRLIYPDMWSQLKKVVLTLSVGSLLFGIGFGAYVYLDLPDVTVLQNQNPRTTALMLQRYRQAQDIGKDLIIRQQWVSFERIPKLLKDTIRISEDANFLQHKGVDLTELKAAIKKNWEKGKYVRGASTITQQLAKNLYLSTDKTITRKIKELLIARRLEKHLKKIPPKTAAGSNGKPAGYWIHSDNTSTSIKFNTNRP